LEDKIIFEMDAHKIVANTITIMSNEEEFTILKFYEGLKTYIKELKFTNFYDLPWRDNVRLKMVEFSKYYPDFIFSIQIHSRKIWRETYYNGKYFIETFEPKFKEVSELNLDEFLEIPKFY